MTLRAFLIGLLAVAVLSLVTPYNDYGLGNTFLTGNHFPVGAFFLLLLLTVGLNALIKLVWPGSALRRAELMLVWCMLIVSATVPGSSLMRCYFTTVSAPPYFAQRPEIRWEENFWDDIPGDLVLSKEVGDRAADLFYEGPGPDQELEIPWGRWVRPMVSWGIFVGFFYLASIFMTAILRRQWVENERLAFPLARVPLELARQSAGPGKLPALFRHRSFQIGAALVILIDLFRIYPVLLGTGKAMQFALPLPAVLSQTRLAHANIWFCMVYPFAIGLLFLVPSSICLSLWFWWLFARFQMQFSHEMGLPQQNGWTPFMRWEQWGAMMMLGLATLWMARRHLGHVARKALGRGEDIDDSDEPIGYTLSFWGLLLSLGGMAGWNVWYGVRPLVAVGTAVTMLMVGLVFARLVAQGGLFFLLTNWVPTRIIQGIIGGRAMNPRGIVVTRMQRNILNPREALAPHAMNALKISGEFRIRRRLFLPAMLAALGVAIICSGWSTMRVFHSDGALNAAETWSTRHSNVNTFNSAQTMITRPERTAARPWGAALGGGLMAALVALHSLFYWWPLHPLGLAVSTTYPMDVLWFSVLLAWLIKVCLLRVAGHRVLRKARTFFLGVVIGECSFIACTAVAGLITGERFGRVFLPW